jgi:hypothetical protein
MRISGTRWTPKRTVSEFLRSAVVVCCLAVVITFLLFAPLEAVGLLYNSISFLGMVVLFGLGAVVSALSYYLAPMPTVRNFTWVCLYGAGIFFAFWALPELSILRQAALARILLILLVVNGTLAHFLQRLLYVIHPLYEAGLMSELPRWAVWPVSLVTKYNKWRNRNVEEHGRE